MVLAFDTALLRSVSAGIGGLAGAERTPAQTGDAIQSGESGTLCLARPAHADVSPPAFLVRRPHCPLYGYRHHWRQTVRHGSGISADAQRGDILLSVVCVSLEVGNDRDSCYPDYRTLDTAEHGLSKAQGPQYGGHRAPFAKCHDGWYAQHGDHQGGRC